MEDVGDAWFRDAVSFVVSVSGLGSFQLEYDHPRLPSRAAVEAHKVRNVAVYTLHVFPEIC